MGICQPQRLQHDYTTVLPRRNSDGINESPTISEPAPNRVLFVINRSSKNLAARKSRHSYLEQDREYESSRGNSSESTVFGDNTLITQMFYENQQLIIQKVGGRPTRTRIDSKIFNKQYLQMLLKPNWEKLIHLRINNNKIGNLGCKYLSKAKIGALQKLGLIQNNIETGGIIHLSKMCLWSLKQLYLGSNKISLGLVHLIKIPMPKIQYINLQNNSIFSFQFQTILISKHEKLSLIDLTWNKLENVNHKKSKKALFLKKYRTNNQYGFTYDNILTC